MRIWIVRNTYFLIQPATRVCLVKLSHYFTCLFFFYFFHQLFHSQRLYNLCIWLFFFHKILSIDVFICIFRIIYLGDLKAKWNMDFFYVFWIIFQSETKIKKKKKLSVALKSTMKNEKWASLKVLFVFSLSREFMS